MQQAKVVCQDIIDIVNKLKSSSIKHIFVGEVFFREKPRFILKSDYNKVRNLINRTLVRHLKKFDGVSFIHFKEIGQSKYLLRNGVHLNFNGYNRYANIIIDRLNQIRMG